MPRGASRPHSVGGCCVGANQRRRQELSQKLHLGLPHVAAALLNVLPEAKEKCRGQHCLSRGARHAWAPTHAPPPKRLTWQAVMQRTWSSKMQRRRNTGTGAASPGAKRGMSMIVMLSRLVLLLSCSTTTLFRSARNLGERGPGAMKREASVCECQPVPCVHR